MPSVSIQKLQLHNSCQVLLKNRTHSSQLLLRFVGGAYQLRAIFLLQKHEDRHQWDNEKRQSAIQETHRYQYHHADKEHSDHARQHVGTELADSANVLLDAVQRLTDRSVFVRSPRPVVKSPQ